MPYIEIEHVTKKFGGETVLHDIDIAMDRNEYI